MRECDNSKIHIGSSFLLSICLIIMLDTLLLVPSLHSNTSQHFATLHHTSPHYTSLHLSTLHFLSFTLHYPLIWLNPSTFPIVLFPLTSLNYTQYGYHIPKLISKIMNPFPTLKNLSPFLLTFYLFFLFFFHLCYQPFTSLYFAVHLYNSLPFTSLYFAVHLYNSLSFTSLYFAIHHYNSLPFTSLLFTFYFLSPSLPALFYTFLTLVLKIRILPWEVPVAPSGSWFQSVMELFTKEYFPMSVLCFLALIFQ